MSKAEQGDLKSRYYVTPRVLVYMFNEEKHEVLLIKGAKNKRLWAGLYNGIGGHLEKGEDIQSSAQRELHEEIGLEKTDLWLCGTVHVAVEERIGVILFVFKSLYNGGSLHDSTEGQPLWINLDAIKEYSTVADVPFILTRCAKWHPGDPIFHLRSYYKNGELTVEDPQDFNS